MRETTKTLAFLLIAGLSLSAFKPKNADVNVYRLPKAKTAEKTARAAYDEVPAHAAMPALLWNLPEGWDEDDVPGMMQSMSVTLPEDTTVSIVELPGKAGGIIANVNRWRGQVGLAPEDESEIMGHIFMAEGHNGALRSIEIAGEKKTILVSLLEMPGRTAFIKIIGATGIVAQNKDNFFAFVKSVRYEVPAE